ncbi:hypothetical protein [Mycolicibacter arupensis]|jgi:hypothetical protein|uniref:Uncharacterized protein n=1 Tax=Mycolicibacter arupensis TaxID=342002 RepID=A0A5C7YDK0_9MYCO|nr:hypothetical protein [Mycolicibacter arupensis]TXI59960.1 MAG: hypothetical protein E6Q54_01435 [Mycolicibacter arupensis]
MLYPEDDPRPELHIGDAAELGGIFASYMIRAVAEGKPDEAEQVWDNAQAVDGGRVMVSELTNIAINAIQEMLTMMRCSGQYEHVPTVGEVADDLRKRYRFNHEATEQINKMTGGDA